MDLEGLWLRLSLKVCLIRLNCYASYYDNSRELREVFLNDLILYIVFLYSYFCLKIRLNISLGCLPLILSFNFDVYLLEAFPFFFDDFFKTLTLLLSFFFILLILENRFELFIYLRIKIC